MEVIRQQSLKDEFSETVARRISQARRISSYKTYDYKVRVYVKWADERGIDPLLADVKDLSEFLEFLFTVKGLQVRTLRVYLSAISLIHPGFDGVKISSHPTFEKLMKGFLH